MLIDTPKPGSPDLEALVARFERAWPPGARQYLLDGAFDQKTLERLLQKSTKGAARPRAQRARQDLVAAAMVLLRTQANGRYLLFKELDAATRAQRNLVRSMAAEDAEQRLSTHGALMLDRHGVKLLWAVTRDERAAVHGLAEGLVARYVSHQRNLARLQEAAEGANASEALALVRAWFGEAGDRLADLEGKVSEADRERARLLAEIGKREAALRQERAARQSIARDVVRATPAPQTSPPDAREASMSGASARLEREHRAAVAENARLREENAALRTTIERLREERRRLVSQATQAQQGDSPPGPLVSSPRSSPRAPAASPAGARVGVFLDVANLAGAARREYQGAPDFVRLLAEVTAGRRLVEARAYIINKDGKGGGDFGAVLRQAGYRVLGKKPKIFPDGTVKADWDVGLAVDVLAIADKLDVVVLGSGDEDYVPLAQALRARNKRVELATFPARTAKALREAVDGVVELDASSLLPSAG